MNNLSLKALVFIGAYLLISTCSTQTFAEVTYKHSESHSDLGFKGIGPRIGFVNPSESLDGTAEFGVAFEFGEFVPQLHWDGSVSFWSTGRNYRYYYMNHGGNYVYDEYDWALRDVILRTGVNYHFIEGPLVPYLGAGLAMHFFSWDYKGQPYLSNTSDSKFGLYIDGGVEHQFNENWTGQVQLQADFVSPDQTALLFNLIYHLE
jgi:opacity protein-like surface antigen